MDLNQFKKYIINKDSNIYSFFIKDNILYMEIIKEHKLIDTKIIVENIKCFCVEDYGECINIVYVDLLGNLVYLRYSDVDIKKDNLLMLDIENNRFKNIKFIISDKNLNIFILTSKMELGSRYSLIHYLISNNTLEKYKLGEVVDDEYDVYAIDVDSESNIHLIYRSFDSDKVQLYYRMFKKSYKRWLIPDKISDRNSDTRHMNLIIDTNDYIHIFWSSIKGKRMNSNYIFKKVDRNSLSNWQTSDSFKPIMGEFEDPILIQLNDDIKLFWKQSNKSYCIKAKVGEYMWDNIKTSNYSINYDLEHSIYTEKKCNNIDAKCFTPVANEIAETAMLNMKMEELNTLEEFNISLNKQNLCFDFESMIIEHSRDINPYIRASNIISDILSKEEVLSKEDFDYEIKRINKELRSLEYEFEQDINDLRKNYFKLSEKIELLSVQNRKRHEKSQGYLYYNKLRGYIKNIMVLLKAGRD
ncbi:hypothetical protein [Alkalithermobacter paradoxus]|uniref:Uncharacterized protein n=1 Tax=Alkalithermobacter paradoxus TaxID=29349 RepID=A0A1V4I9C4_9FIRM|nr:hypothetical protein CLOTH_09180 [[Clostridium] thermoalcaliphilum]